MYRGERKSETDDLLIVS